MYLSKQQWVMCMYLRLYLMCVFYLFIEVTSGIISPILEDQLKCIIRKSKMNITFILMSSFCLCKLTEKKQFNYLFLINIKQFRAVFFYFSG